MIHDDDDAHKLNKLCRWWMTISNADSKDKDDDMMMASSITSMMQMQMDHNYHISKFNDNVIRTKGHA